MHPAQVSLDLKKCGSDGKVQDFLHTEVKTITVELTERTWDRQGTLRIGSVDVVDYFTKKGKRANLAFHLGGVPTAPTLQLHQMLALHFLIYHIRT